MTSFLLSATDCWAMQDQISQMRIMFFARTGEKLQTAQGPWLVALQGLAQGLVEASSFCELKDVFIKHYFKSTPSILVKSVLPEVYIFLSHKKQAYHPKRFAYFLREKGGQLPDARMQFSITLQPLSPEQMCTNFLYVFWHCI